MERRGTLGGGSNKLSDQLHGEMWEREWSVMLPTFLYWLTGWMLMSLPKQKVKEEGKRKVIKSTLNRCAYYARGTAK